MDIKDIIELSKNGFTPADIKDLINTMNEKPEVTVSSQEPAAAAVEPAAAAAEPEQATDKTQELINAIQDLKRSIQASNIRKDTGAAQTQNVEDVLATLVR